jgi:hypothetical protein
LEYKFLTIIDGDSATPQEDSEEYRMVLKWYISFNKYQCRKQHSRKRRTLNGVKIPSSR